MSANHQKLEERHGADSRSQSTEGTTLLTPRFQTPNLWNCKMMQFCHLRSQDVTPSPAGVHRIFSPATRLSLMNSRTPVPETSDFRVPRDSLKTSPTPSHPAPATTTRKDRFDRCLSSVTTDATSRRESRKGSFPRARTWSRKRDYNYCHTRSPSFLAPRYPNPRLESGKPRAARVRGRPGPQPGTEEPEPSPGRLL